MINMASSRRTTEERLAAEREKMEQMKNTIKVLEQRQKNEERKARTKRLNAIGAEVEHYAGCQIDNLESFKAYLEQYAYAIANTQKAPAITTRKESKVSPEINSTSFFDTSVPSPIS